MRLKALFLFLLVWGEQTASLVRKHPPLARRLSENPETDPAPVAAPTVQEFIDQQINRAIAADRRWNCEASGDSGVRCTFAPQTNTPDDDKLAVEFVLKPGEKETSVTVRNDDSARRKHLDFKLFQTRYQNHMFLKSITPFVQKAFREFTLGFTRQVGFSNLCQYGQLVSSEINVQMPAYSVNKDVCWVQFRTGQTNIGSMIVRGVGEYVLVNAAAFNREFNFFFSRIHENTITPSTRNTLRKAVQDGRNSFVTLDAAKNALAESIRSVCNQMSLSFKAQPNRWVYLGSQNQPVDCPFFASEIGVFFYRFGIGKDQYFAHFVVRNTYMQSELMLSASDPAFRATVSEFVGDIAADIKATRSEVAGAKEPKTTSLESVTKLVEGMGYAKKEEGGATIYQKAVGPGTVDLTLSTAETEVTVWAETHFDPSKVAGGQALTKSLTVELENGIDEEARVRAMLTKFEQSAQKRA